MAEQYINSTVEINATLKKIEDEYGHFEIENGIENQENLLQWPLNKLPDGIQIGDTVKLTLNFALSEERQNSIREQEQKEEKFREMRKLLEDLVN